MSIPASLITVLIGQTKSWYANEPEKSLIEDIKRRIFVLPLVIAWDFVLFGAGIAICIIQFKLFIINMISFLVFFRCLGIVSGKFLKLKSKSQKSLFTVFKLLLVDIWSFAFMVWTILMGPSVMTEGKEDGYYVINIIAKITIFANIFFAILILIVFYKIKKEFTSDAFWSPVKI